MRTLLFFFLNLFLPICLWAANCPGGGKIDYKMQQFLAKNQIPGAAVAVYVQGKTYYFNYGVADLQSGQPVTKTTLFYIASLTKVFTSTLLAEEIEKGRLGLYDPIVNYLPELSDTSNLPIDQVTTQELATFTSSFPREIQDFGVSYENTSGLMDALKNWQPQSTIGSTYQYSNIGYDVLGLVLQDETKTDYETLLNQNIFTPLGMENSYINVPDDKSSQQATGYDTNNQRMATFLQESSLIGSGQIQSSTSDLIRFVKANLNNPTSHSTPELLNAMQLAQQTYFHVNDTLDLGLGWFKQRAPGSVIYKDGAYPGYSSFIAFIPDKQIGVVILVNKNHQEVGDMAFTILRILSKN